MLDRPSGFVQCPRCSSWLSGTLFRQTKPVECPQCFKSLSVMIFPALFRSHETGSAGETIQIEGEAGCFFHPDRRAIVACENCGRFLCSLCHIRLGDRNLCPTCIEAGKKKGRFVNLDHRRTRYDNIAISLVVYPMLFGCLTVFTAPLCLFWVVRHWNSPRSIVSPSRWKFVLAFILSCLQMAGWLTLLVIFLWHKIGSVSSS